MLSNLFSNYLHVLYIWCIQQKVLQYLAILLVTFFGMLKWPFQRLSDLQLGDKKVTLNHLVQHIYHSFCFCVTNPLVIFLPHKESPRRLDDHPTTGRTSVSRVEQCMSRSSAAAVPSNYSWTCNVWEGRPVFFAGWVTHITFLGGLESTWERSSNGHPSVIYLLFGVCSAFFPCKQVMTLHHDM